MGSPVLRSWLALVVLAAAVGASPAVAGQAAPPGVQPNAMTGRVTAGHSAAAVSGAVVTIEETGQSAVSGPDGTYRIIGVRPGRVHVRVSAESFAPNRLEVQVVETGA